MLAEERIVTPTLLLTKVGDTGWEIAEGESGVSFAEFASGGEGEPRHLPASRSCRAAYIADRRPQPGDPAGADHGRGPRVVRVLLGHGPMSSSDVVYGNGRNMIGLQKGQAISSGSGPRRPLSCLERMGVRQAQHQLRMSEDGEEHLVSGGDRRLVQGVSPT